MNQTRKHQPSQLKVSVHARNAEADELDARVLDDEHAGTASLDKVRDILFGAQSREYEKRFTRLEERLLKEAAELRNDLKSRFDSLEQYVKHEVESLTSRMKNEQKEKTESLGALSRELGQLGKLLQERVAQLDEQTIQGQRELRQQVLEQHKSLSQEIQQKSADLSVMFEQAIEELRGEKLDRASLAEMFMESALRLNNDFKLPTKE
ncbi:MAG: hypothetical protein NPIRA02_04970 [Nitrospirales bacterium]|nr:MAG: hypothetical protein NPIRA02_04970 [Nitrospirales bacterium]